MSGIPLHPLVVHFPIVLSILLPLATLAAILAGFRSETARKYWPAVLILHALLLTSAYIAVQSGEKDEEKVEEVLASEDPLETHEEKAELFLKVTGAALLLSLLGLAPGAYGVAGRVLGGAGALAILLLGYQVGHSGGELIYRHGAAAAYAPEADGGRPASPGAGADAAPSGTAGKMRETRGDGEED